MNALNIAPFIEAESDRIIGDDLIAGPQTHIVAGVEGTVDEKKKKRLIVRLEGTQKPFMPCKGMARLLGHLWGPDAAQWVGRTMILYRDPDVRFGADMTGGVRICAVSNIERSVKVPIRTSQKSVKQYDIEPIITKPIADPAQKWADGYIAAVAERGDLDTLNAFANSKAVKLAELESKRPELHRECVEALAARRTALAPLDASDDFADDDFDTETGEVFDETPAWSDALGLIKEAIAAAKTKPELGVADADFTKMRAGLPDDVVDAVELLIAAKRGAFA